MAPGVVLVSCDKSFAPVRYVHRMIVSFEPPVITSDVTRKPARDDASVAAATKITIKIAAAATTVVRIIVEVPACTTLIPIRLPRSAILFVSQSVTCALANKFLRARGETHPRAWKRFSRCGRLAAAGRYTMNISAAHMPPPSQTSVVRGNPTGVLH